MYLNHKETQIQTPSNLLAALWRQLVLGKVISIESQVQKLYQNSEKHPRPTLTDICELLSLEVAQWSKVYIVVDALDECPEDERMVLLERLTTMGPTVNLMLTSRPHITLPSLPYMDIKIRASNEDIHYHNDRESVAGMFLLAKLHMESLATKVTMGAVRQALENLPRDLDAAYEVTMNRINQQETESRDLALAALTWVTNAKRVLEVVELREVLAVKAGTKNLDPDDRPEVSTILNVCAGLIIVDKTSSTIRLVHYSTQDYLDRLFPNAQTDITRTLLTYLAFDDLQSFLDKTASTDARMDYWTRQDMEQKYPLIHYCEYCLVHAVGLPEEELGDMILNFLEAAIRWHRLMHTQNPPRNRWRALPWDFQWPSSPSTLWVAAAANLLKIAENLLNHGEVPNDKDKEMLPLCVASSKGHIQMVKLLGGASLSWEAGCNCRALQLASQYGHTEIVQFLLESGADVNAEEPHGPDHTALQAAIRYGCTGIVHLLFDNGANINVLGKDFPSAFH
ncbi:NACHT and ankyrin domain protein [Mycena venus]|uniref:NACHT and ankyrin domain protein n=1 Tax=Mycena venus TaxID=2733690 RepID=A0A8H6YRA0_9AGAR|nr:NACHT and ankyrin domain protein [Mycena venus]